MKKNRRTVLLLTCLALGLTALAYLPSLNNDFTNWDDPEYVTNNAQIRELSWKNTAAFFTDIHHPSLNLYKPLVNLSYAVEYHFFGLDPRIYHATNLVLHLVNVFLVFRLILLLDGSALAAFIVAALFGVHPLHVESVAWVTERKDVLYSAFFLASCVAYLKFHQKKLPRFYILSIFLFGLSLLSKPAAATLPFILLLFDGLAGRLKSVRGLLEKLPFFAVMLVLGFLTVRTSPEVLEPMRWLKPYHLLRVSDDLIFYVMKLAAPLRLSGCYLFTNKPGHLLLDLPSSIFLVPAAGALILFTARRSPKIIFGCLFFLITLLPSFAFATADRYTYIPSLGFFYILAVIFERILRWAEPNRRQKYFLLLALALLLAVFSYGTQKRCEVWKNSLTFWNDVLDKAPKNAWPDTTRADILNKNSLSAAYEGRASHYLAGRENDKAISDLSQVLRLEPGNAHTHSNLAIAYAGAGEYEKALEEFEEALRLEGDFAEALNNRGGVRAVLGEHAKAIEDYTRTLKLKPDLSDAYVNRAREYAILGLDENALADYSRAIALNPADVQAYGNRADIYAKLGDFSRAEADRQSAGKISARLGTARKGLDKLFSFFHSFDHPAGGLGADGNAFVLAYNNRGAYHLFKKEDEKAIQDLNRAVELAPGYASARNNRGLVYSNLGQRLKAVEDFKEAVRLKPDYAEAYNNLGYEYCLMRDFEGALNCFNQALKVDPENASAYNNRGIEYNRLGLFEKALSDFRRAKKIDPGSKPAEANLRRSQFIGEKISKFDWELKIENSPLKRCKLLYNLGTLYADMGTSDQAILYLDRAIEINPRIAEAYNNRGSLYQEAGKDKEALADYKKVIELEPDFAEAYFNRALILEKRGDAEDAKNHYRRFLELAAEQPPAVIEDARKRLKKLERVKN